MRFLFVDRITDLSQNMIARGLKHVTRDDYYLCQDKDGEWCFIPSILGETIGQLAAWHVMMQHDFRLRPVAGIAGCATVHRPAYLGETVTIETKIDALDSSVVQYHGEARVGDEVIFCLEGAIGPLLPMEDFIDSTLVRRQFDEINRPYLPTHQESFDQTVLDKGQYIAPVAPRTAVAPMCFDQVVAYEPAHQITAVKRLTRAAPYFPDHFPNKPVLPMTVLLESFLNLSQSFIQREGLSGHFACRRVRRVKMSDFIVPGDVVTGIMTLKNQTDHELVFHCRCDVSGKRVGVLEITMGKIG
jgi:3-hydroxymyristoyl/3-hydroxydecanoyl-(acyl carrier protein) dehydratase